MSNILIIGGNRFFGRHLASQLIDDGANVTLLNRGTIKDNFGDQVNRIFADRTIHSSMKQALGNKTWDIVYDQVCYTAEEARSACKLFENRTKRYIVTSSESIYDDGINQKEINFNPKSFYFTTNADRYSDYQIAKRQVESIFTRFAQFDIAIVRPSLVVGIDDYTNRLKWHLDRIKNGLPIYFPNKEIHMDFIRSDQAGLALKIVGYSNHTGPINCSTPSSISMMGLIKMCEKITGERAILEENPQEKIISPIGGNASKTMNTDLLHSIGFNAKPSISWMEELFLKLNV